MFSPISRRFLILVLCAAVALPVWADENLGLPQADPASVGMAQEKLDAIPKSLNMFVARKQLPGFVSAVAKDGKLVHFSAIGKRDVERDLPMENDTIFRMYSMTKPVTGAAVMILIDEGKISVDDPVSKYIPEFAELKVMETAEDGSTKIVPAKTVMTIKHLLTHTSGLSYGIFDPSVAKYYTEADVMNPDITLEEFAKRAATLPLVANPGEKWTYSIAMDVLGRVVEVVSGQRFGDFLQARIFGPLKMVDSGFYVPEEKWDRFAANYGPTAKKDGMTLIDDPATSAFRKLPGNDSGGGGMVGTVSDYLRFAQMLVNGGELDGVRILSEEIVEEMTSNQLPESLGKDPLGDMLPLNSEGIGFGYTGAAIMDGYTNTLFGSEGHYAWGGYASTDFWIDKKHKIAGVICTQLIPTGTYPQRVLFQNLVYGAMGK